MSSAGTKGEDLTNFSFRLQHLHSKPGDLSSLTLELVITQGIYQQTLLVPYSDLNQLDIQQEVPGCVYLTSKAKREVAKEIRLAVAQALQSQSQIGELYPQTGWYRGTCDRVFVAGGAVISRDGIAPPKDAVIARETAQFHLAMDHTLTAGQAAEQLLKSLTEYDNYGIPAFAYTLYSMLHSVWSEANLPTACVLNLIGTQGFGKTTLARNFCALYDDPSGNIADFYDAQSTPTSIKNALGEAKDRIVVVDDICKSTSPREMQKRRDLTGHILRNAANETPVAKMNGDNTVNFTCVSGLVLTGELPLEVASDITRCVILNVEKPLRNGDSDDRTIAATAAAHYMQWLLIHFDEELSRLKSSFRTFSDNSKTQKNWRLQKSLFQLDWVFDSFLRFSNEAKAISELAHCQFEKRAANIFRGIFSYEDALVQRIESAQPSRWPQLILAGVEQKKLPYSSKAGCICVHPDNLTQYLRIVLQRPSLQKQEIINELKMQNLLLMDKSEKSTKKVKGVRMLHIKISPS